MSRKALGKRLEWRHLLIQLFVKNKFHKFLKFVLQTLTHFKKFHESRIFYVTKLTSKQKSAVDQLSDLVFVLVKYFSVIFVSSI